MVDSPVMSKSRSESGPAAETATPNALSIADPALAKAAATLIAAGYLVVPPANSERAHLSARELQVAALLLEGASNKAIARSLDISVHTVKFHVTAVLDKLGARNRADAVSIILRDGRISL